MAYTIQQERISSLRGDGSKVTALCVYDNTGKLVDVAIRQPFEPKAKWHGRVYNNYPTN